MAVSQVLLLPSHYPRKVYVVEPLFEAAVAKTTVMVPLVARPNVASALVTALVLAGGVVYGSQLHHSLVEQTQTKVVG